ncbi:MAG: hydantoinase/oxoprolinase family protein [Burkholderiaceae bacterium]|jgi:N-methylhydantoinase A|nr:hydantoinase/oxoprolinase family protein [Burkholderiaceae bacterium]
MGIRVGVDVGGTFTDFLVKDSAGVARIYKTSTTPSDPTIGLFNGLGKAADEAGLSLKDWLAQVETIVHGTTITTNAVLTGEGAVTGFITTAGFRDILNMRRGLKEHQFEIYSQSPALVPRRRIAVVRERISSEGKVLTPLVEDDVRAAAVLFREQEVEAVAVSYLWSFRNPVHEERTRAILEQELPGVYVSTSTEILPQIRTYERHSTTVLNSYVGPVLNRYLSRLQDRLRELGFGGSLLIMQSNGGVMSPEVAQRFASNTLLSGPAGAPQAGLHGGSLHNFRNLITVDMGGTSFDVALIRNGVPTVTTEGNIGGHRIASPSLDIHTVGSGGGSIAWVDSGGLLKVGPKSAGAQPGPACYGRGGTLPTVTDANNVLGYLDFAGAELTLTRDSACQAVEKHIAEPLGMEVAEAAHGIYEVVNADMAAAISVVSVQRGYDPREFVLVVAGGAGPLHAGPIARDLEIPLIQIPRESSVFCAAGMLISDIKHDYVYTYAREFDAVDLDAVAAIYQDIVGKARQTLQAEHVAPDRVVVAYSADLRYVGQFNEVEVPAFADGKFTADGLKKLAADFHRRHDDLYGYSTPNSPMEIINLRVSVRGITDKPSVDTFPEHTSDPSAARTGSRRAWFEGAFMDTPVFDGMKLFNGNVVSGPAIVVQPTTTILVPPDFELCCDAANSYLMYRKGAPVKALIKKLNQETNT